MLLATTVKMNAVGGVLTSIFIILATTGTHGLSSVAVPATTKGSYNRIVKNVAVPGLQNGMDYIQLGDSDLIVSKVCMGTMTFGEQNTVEDGVTQLNKAFDEYGVNFLDTAEMYPVPTKPDTQGTTDHAVAKFIKSTSLKREDIILATKVCGRSDRIDWLPRRQDKTSAAVTKEQIIDSVDASLKRLGTDYIDLLQIHWPDRMVGGLFGQPDFTFDKYEEAPVPVDFVEQLEGLQHVINEGKVRYVGVSNETPFGVCSFVQLAQQFPDLYPKIVSIQNSYSLCVRKDYEAGLAETCYHHNVGLLAYSPLAGGSLSGKYRGDPAHIPKGARLTLFPGFMDRYLGSQNEMAVNAYCDIAEKSHANLLSPAQLALSWCYHNPNVASTIIGETSMEQLEENLKSYDINVWKDDNEDNIMSKIDVTYKLYTDPTKSRN